MHPAIQKKHIQAIRKNPGTPVQKQVLLTCSSLVIPSPAILKEYHDALLFVVAFPADEEARLLAISELKRLVALIGKRQGFYWQNALTGSALPGTLLQCQYTRHLQRWLLETCPEAIQPAEAGAGADEVKAIFQVLLPGIEFNGATRGSKSVWSRIRVLSGHYFNQEALDWLLTLVEQQPFSELLKDQLFDRLQIFISWTFTEEGINRSTIQWPVMKFHYYTPGKTFSSATLLKRKIKKEILLDQAEKARLITIARASLAFYLRETDPFTYAEPGATLFLDMGDGYQVALFGMTNDRRFSLDSYIGFLAFKNGIPVAYGGGWIFGHRCKIGVNIYPPFRGADSAVLFTQVLRAYYQQFQVHYFVVKPYQFGKGNPEGLKSGAYWFYYKLGFRSADSHLGALAHEEWERIRKNKGYRSPLPILKKLTGSVMILVVNKKGLTDPRASAMSGRISNMIRDQFAGNRKAALQEANRYWLEKTGVDLSAFPGHPVGSQEDWVLLFLVLSDRNQPVREWKKLARLRFAGREADFIKGWQENRMLWSGPFEPANSK